MQTRIAKPITLAWFLIGSVFTTLLTGCGFHLKGQGGESAVLQTAATEYWQEMTLIADVSELGISPLKPVLLKQLQQQKVNFTWQQQPVAVNSVTIDETLPTPTLSSLSNQIVLRVNSPKIISRQTAQSSLGTTSAELLIWQQSYQLVSAEGELLRSAKLSAQRDRQINSAVLLASDSERQQILQDMAAEIAVQMLQGINRYAAMQLLSPASNEVVQ